MAIWSGAGSLYVIRSGGSTSIEHPHYRGALQDLITERGERCDLNNVRLRKTRPVHTRVVALWEPGQAEPWCLTTNLSLPARAIVRLYSKRFQIEETFRDQKCSRLGFGLSEITMHSAARLEKLLLIVALAHILALFIGAISVPDAASLTRLTDCLWPHFPHRAQCDPYRPLASIEPGNQP